MAGGRPFRGDDLYIEVRESNDEGLQWSNDQRLAGPHCPPKEVREGNQGIEAGVGDAWYFGQSREDYVRPLYARAVIRAVEDRAEVPWLRDRSYLLFQFVKKK